jgi:agarase
LKLPENALKLAGDRAVKQAFTKLLRDKYTDIARLNDAWGSQVASWDEFQAQPVSPPLGAATVRADLSMMLTDFAKRYFTVISALMRQYAPNQLYLGPRFAVAPDECVLEAAKYCDVVSYNIYGRAPSIVSRGEQIRKLDKPVVIGEFHFGALDRGMFHGGLGPVANQEERGVECARYIQTALDQPWCVGAHWFTYGDEALTGRFDGENYNIGFVNVTDTPYVELVRHATEVNFAVYQRRGR